MQEKKEGPAAIRSLVHSLRVCQEQDAKYKRTDRVKIFLFSSRLFFFFGNASSLNTNQK